jgi:hypothetical protein
MFKIARSIVAVTCLAVFVMVQPVRADAPPKADEILDKNIEATGGKAAHEKCKNRVEKGTIEVASIGIKGDMTSYSAAASKLYVFANLKGFGQIEEGTDGKVAWSINPTTGPRVKEGAERDAVLRRADLEGQSNWRKYIKKAECTGEDTIEGKPCYKIELTTTDGQTATHYYDKSTYLLLKSIGNEKTANGDVNAESIFSDYRKVDGVMLPFKTRQTVVSTEIVVTLDKVEHNVELPANRFDLPDEIKKLIGKPGK